ncbi:hypothetical protein G7046_g3306 [Stylonectria norvegica]|nr:hypothetical protein G7046_g3306 [Stylonectria norvegica]
MEDTTNTNAGQGRSPQVRFAEGEHYQYVPQRHRRPQGRSSGTDSRRDTSDNVDVSSRRRGRRQDSHESRPRAGGRVVYIAGDVPAPGTQPVPVTPRRVVQTRSGDSWGERGEPQPYFNVPQPDNPRLFTESPPPIEPETVLERDEVGERQNSRRPASGAYYEYDDGERPSSGDWIERETRRRPSSGGREERPRPRLQYSFSDSDASFRIDDRAHRRHRSRSPRIASYRPSPERHIVRPIERHIERPVFAGGPDHHHYASYATPASNLTLHDPRYPSRARSPSVGSDDDWDTYERFEFVLPSKSIPESSRADDSDTEYPDPEEQVQQRSEAVGSRASKATLIHAAQYTGSAELGGSHNATLTTLHDPKSQKQSLFRWLHVRQEVMNFDDFWAEVSHVPGLSDVEKGAMARLRADVKKICVKSRYNPKGAKVGHLEPRSVEVPLKSSKKEDAMGKSASGLARWICVPYFSLEPYSGLLAASRLTSFPSQTLLQSQYSRNTLQRDMDQAVCQLGTGKRGECFHIAQLWSIVVGNSLLLTCGSMTQPELLGDQIKVNVEPDRDLSRASSQGNILVSYGESVVWSMAAEECQTWFVSILLSNKLSAVNTIKAFVSKFQAFWPQTLEFRHNDQVITAEKWPNMLRRVASSTRANFKIELKTLSRPDAPVRAVLRPLKDKTATQAGKGKPGGSPEEIHVLALMPENSKGEKPTPDAALEDLKARLQAAETFLLEETSFSNRKAYRNASESTRHETYGYLGDLAIQVEANGADSIRRSYEERIDIFNAADMVHGVFLPNAFDDPTSRKFWGAIRALVNLPEFGSSQHFTTVSDIYVTELRSSLRSITHEIQAFQNVMSYASEDFLAGIKMPRDFVTAWLCVVMAVIYGAENDSMCSSRMARAKDLSSLGMKKVIHSLTDKSLLEKAIVLPLEVLSLVTLGLLQDQVGKSDDICETYSEYLKSLETSITYKPSDRSYQHRIDLVQQEMTAVKRVLGKQRSLITSIRNSLGTGSYEGASRNNNMRSGRIERERERQREMMPYGDETPYRDIPGPPGDTYDFAYPVDSRAAYQYQPTAFRANDYMNLDEEFVDDIASASRLSPTNAGGLRELFLRECARVVEQREFEFRRYTEYATDLERAIIFKMDWTKDRQENAIFAFTIVTIIFLPLGTVSSILVALLGRRPTADPGRHRLRPVVDG